MYTPAITALVKHFHTLFALSQAEGVLSWDQQVMMPDGGASTRAETLASLATLSHQFITSEETKKILQEAVQGDGSAEEKRISFLSEKMYDHSRKIPEHLATELARATSVAQNAWEQARANNDYALFAPHLQRVLDLTRQQVEALGYQEHIYDALLDLYEPGATHAHITALFQELKPALLELISLITSKQAHHSELWKQEYDVTAQRQLSEFVLGQIGFDFTRGRQDKSAHPFCTNFGRGDVRITTRFDPNYLPMALYGSLHEMGHGLYEQGSPEKYEQTVLAGGVSLGVHESQSRLWENLVGRSLPFTKWLYPHLQEMFPTLSAIPLEQYYQAINYVQPSLIRVEADEVTYNLHILTRFELESDLLTGSLSVDDLPEAWNAKMREYFGITPPNNAQGVLQDVHWSSGLIGYFPTYTLGNLLSTQLMEATRSEIPTLDDQLESGNFAPLLAWLREHIHSHASLLPTEQLIFQATGKPLSAGSYIRYLHAKFVI